MTKNKVPTLDELQNLYKDLGGKGDVVPSGKKGSSVAKKKVKSEPPPPVENTSDTPDEAVYCEVHFFLRQNSVWHHCLQDARVEANVRGSTVLVFAHNHTRGDKCDHLCRMVRGE